MMPGALATLAGETARLVEQLPPEAALWLAEVDMRDVELPRQPSLQVLGETALPGAVGTNRSDQRRRAVQASRRDTQTESPGERGGPKSQRHRFGSHPVAGKTFVSRRRLRSESLPFQDISPVDVFVSDTSVKVGHLGEGEIQPAGCHRMIDGGLVDLRASHLASIKIRSGSGEPPLTIERRNWRLVAFSIALT